MKRTIYFLCIGALLTGLVSCKKFLTVKPATQLTEKDAFASDEGFQQALNGLYAQAASRNLYGDHLSMGFSSALSQDYLMTASGAPLREAKNFNYTTSSVTTTTNEI